MCRTSRLRIALLLTIANFVATVGAQNQPAPPVLRTDAASVLVDVVVTGRDGAPIDGLKQSNFSVREDGHPQPIRYFEAHTGTAGAQAVAPLPPGTYANRMELPPESSVDVLLLDGLNTELKDQATVRAQMIKYLRSVPPGKHIAVFTLASQLRLVKGFNSDSSSLLAALESGKLGTPQVSGLVQTEADRNQQKRMEDIALENSLAGGAGAAAGLIELAHLQQFEADQLAFQTDLRVGYTLKALQEISRYLAGLPVRKNLIWLSASFPLVLLPDNDLTNPNNNLRNYAPELEHTARMLSLARVALYPVDARGLFPPNSFGAGISGGSSIRQLNQQLRDDRLRFEQDASVRETMESIAQETGGEAIVNTNDLAGALHQIDSSAAHYYTLSYTPPNPRANGKIRRIHIEASGVNGSVRLLYRRSYVPGPALAAGTRLQEADTRRLLIAAMAHQAPVSTGIHFEVKVEPQGPVPEQGPLLGENSSLKPPATRYRLMYRIEANSFQLETASGGVMQGSVVILTVAYDQHGRVMNSQTSTLALHFPSALYPEFLRQGIQFRQELDVPAGAISLRAGVFDAESQTLGSLELPLG